jgi:uncharacterized membrane protein (DUF106 family)
MAFFEWFLALPPIISIMAVCLLLSLFSLLTMKFMTDQKLLKRLRSEQKDLQKKMRAAKDDQKKLMEYQRQAMEGSMEMMKQTMKVSIITIIPFFLIMTWLNTHIGYYPLIEDTPFNITAAFEPSATGNIELVNVPKEITVLNGANQSIRNSTAEWDLVGKAGRYTLTYKIGEATFQHQIVITTGERTYAKPILTPKELGIKNTNLKTITVSNQPVRPFAIIPVINMIPWLKDRGWFFTYFLFAIIFSIIFRRILNVY